MTGKCALCRVEGTVHRLHHQDGPLTLCLDCYLQLKATKAG
ncbi:hypothetical protein ACFWPU_00930 [Streptomyces sp. NPDC058471]